MGSYGYGPSLNRNTYKGYGSKSDEGEDTSPIFKVLIHPEQLDKLDIVWSIALETENPKVVSKVWFYSRLSFFSDLRVVFSWS